MLQVTPVPAFNDNYIWLFRQADADRVCVVDPGDADPVLAWLEAQQCGIEAIILTHHHGDHIGGVEALLARYDVPVYGPRDKRIPCATHPVAEGDRVTLAGITLQVIAVPGHTMEHIAYYGDNSDNGGTGPVLFCGDTLFAGGCGRMFEGTAPVMQQSLQKLAGLDPQTRVYCAHEYTLANLAFAAAAMPDNAALRQRIDSDRATRDSQRPTVPSTLAVELATNPFLRWQDPEVIASLRARDAIDDTGPASVFGALRRWKDNF